MKSNLLKCIFAILLAPAVLLARDPVAYVVNTSGETLSKINLATGEVENDILTIGSDVLCYPNQIVVRDSLAYVLVSGTDEIQIIDLSTETTLGYIDLGSGSSPFWMAFLDSQYVYVTNFSDNSLAKVDVIDRTVVSTEAVGLSPEGVMIRRTKAYVAITAFDPVTWQYGQGRVVVYDTQTDSAINQINVGTNPQYIAGDTLGRIHVVCTGDYWSTFGMIYVIDPVLDAVVDSFAIGGSPGNIMVGPDNIAYIAAGGWVADGYVYTYDALSGQVYHSSGNPLVVDYGCVAVAAYQDTTVFAGAFTDFVTRIDSAGTELDRFAVGDGPISIDFNYLPGDLDGDFRVDIVDLIWMVDWFFRFGPPPRYPRWRAYVDGDCSCDISDLVYLVRFMFQFGPPLKVGPTWLY